MIILAGIIFAGTVGMVLWRIFGSGGGYSPRAATAPATPQTTTPAVSVAPAGMGFWVGFWKFFWIFLVIGAVAGAIWFAGKMANTSSPRTVPQLQKKTFDEKLRFLGGEKIVRQSDGTILIHDGGYLELEIEGLPVRRGASYWINLSIQQESDGRHLLSVNGAPPYQLNHLASPRVENKVLFLERVDGKVFHKDRPNFFRLSSPKDKIIFHSASIEAEWYE